MILVDPRESAKSVAKNCYLPAASRCSDSDQIIQFQLRASAFPRGLELLFHKAGIVFLALRLSACCNPNNERGLRGWWSKSSRKTFSAPALSRFIRSAAPSDSRTGKNQSSGSEYLRVSWTVT